jgi:putative Mn2+ efflux pump MntP
MILGSRRVNTTSRTYAAKNLAVLSALSLMVAINAFMVGIGLGLISIDVMILAGILFFTTYILALVGVRIGKLGKHQLGRQSELFGGSLLLLIALMMFLQYVNIL